MAREPAPRDARTRVARAGKAERYDGAVFAKASPPEVLAYEQLREVYHKALALAFLGDFTIRMSIIVNAM